MTDDQDTTPADVVHRQIDAYNDGDVDEFARCFDERAVIAGLADGEPVAEGRDDIREQYGELFQSVPGIHCEVTDQLTMDDFVVCLERVTGMDEPVEALAVYLVDGDAIRRLWLGEG